LFSSQIIEIPEGNLTGKIENVRVMIKETKNMISTTLVELKSYLENLNDLERGQVIGGNSPLAGLSKL